MKTIDVSKHVMDEVVHFEKKRSLWWLGRFLFIFLVLLAVGVWFLWIAVTQIFERRTLELLTLFKEDRETIAQFWQDTFSVFWQELPQRKLIVVALAIVAIFILLFLTRRKRAIIEQKIRHLAKYH